MSKKKIIISGATSAIMDAVIDLIQLQKKYHIVGITSRLRKGQRKDIEWVECDLTLAKNDYSFIKGADTIIHAAAISNATKLQDYFNINLRSTEALIDQANRFKVNRFIYISSIVACEKCGGYGLSKVFSEKYIKSNFNKWLIIRPSQLYGYSETEPIDSLIKKIAIKKFIPCPVGDPYSLRPIYYLDAAQLIFNTIFVENLSNTTKVVIGPQAFNYKSLILEIAKSLQKKVLIIAIPKIVMMSLKKLIQILGTKVMVHADQIVRLYNSDEKYTTPENKELMRLSEYIRRQIER